METTGIAGLEASVQKTREWLNEIAAELGWDEHRKAYQALRGTLHALRDRLTVEEAVHLGAQLPMLIRGMYFEGWSVSGKPVKLGRQEFLERIRSAFGPTRVPNPNDVARAVFRVLERHVTAGELRDVRGSLPRELRALWDNPDESAA